MSRLDKLYKNYRRYCQSQPSRSNELIELIIYENGAGRLIRKRTAPIDGNPLRISTEEVVRFDTPGDGADKLENIITTKEG